MAVAHLPAGPELTSAALRRVAEFAGLASRPVEEFLARETGNLSLHLSLPIVNDVVINRSYAGYRGGLQLMEDICAGIFRVGDVAFTTLTRNKR